MPKVNEGESRSSYMARCVPVVIKEGLSQEQAVGKCEGMFDQARKSMDPIAKAACLAKNLIHDPKDESGRIEGPEPEKETTVAKAGYKNPPDELDPQLQGTISNSATGIVSCSNADEAIRVHKDRTLSIYGEVYKQARLAGYSPDVASREAETAVAAVNKEYRENLIREIASERAKLGNRI